MLIDSDSILKPISTEVAHTGEYAMSQWPLARAVWIEAAYDGLGACLSELHSVSPPSGLPHFERGEKGADRIRAAEVAGGPRSLLDRIGERRASLQDDFQTDPRDEAVIHCDAHIGNLVEFGSRPRLIDLDGICVGPWQMDLVPAAVAYDRLGLDQRKWQEFARHFPSDPATWEHWDQAKKYRELTMTTWLASLWGRPGVSTELEHRLNTWDAPPRSHTPWSPV